MVLQVVSKYAKVFCSFFEKGHYKIVLRSISTFLPKFW